MAAAADTKPLNRKQVRQKIRAAVEGMLEEFKHKLKFQQDLNSSHEWTVEVRHCAGFNDCRHQPLFDEMVQAFVKEQGFYAYVRKLHSDVKFVRYHVSMDVSDVDDMDSRSSTPDPDEEEDKPSAAAAAGPPGGAMTCGCGSYCRCK